MAQINIPDWLSSSIGQNTFPAYSTTARDAAFPTPAAGWAIFNTTTNTFQGHNGTTWRDLAVSGGSGSGVIAVKGISSSNIVIAGGLVNGGTSNGITYATDDLILLGDSQTLATERGIYVVPVSGNLTRSPLMAAASNASGVLVYAQGQQVTYQQVSSPAVVDTNALSFRALGNPSLAENGTLIGGSTTTIALNASGDLTGTTFVLPTAGTYEVTYRAIVNPSSNTGTEMTIRTGPSAAPSQTGTLVPNSLSTLALWTGAGTPSLPLGATCFIDVSVPNSQYHLVGRVFGGGGSASFDMAPGLLTWKKVSGFLPLSQVSAATPGDRKFSSLTADHGDWVLLDGRAVSSLSAASQAACASLGISGNLPDMRGRFPLGAGGAYGIANNALAGSTIIAQNQLPNVTLTGNISSGSFIQGGSDYVTSPSGITGFRGVINGSQFWTGATITAGPPVTTTSINGNVTQQMFFPNSIAGNWFIFLGNNGTTVAAGWQLPLTQTSVATSATLGTTGSTGTVLIDPPTVVPSLVITLPLNVPAGQDLTYVFGGSIGFAQPVCTVLSFVAPSGFTVLNLGGTPVSAISGDAYTYRLVGTQFIRVK